MKACREVDILHPFLTAAVDSQLVNFSLSTFGNDQDRLRLKCNNNNDDDDDNNNNNNNNNTEKLQQIGQI